MAPPSSNLQKTLVLQFCQLTGCSDRTAQRYLRNANYKIHEALNIYYSTGSVSSDNAALEDALNKLFDTLKDPDKDSSNALGVDSSMSYLSHHLDVDLENAGLFVVLELIQAPSIGEITRKGYVDGWKSVAATSGQSIPTNHKSHAAVVQSLIASLSTDASLFKKVYRYAFVVGKEPNQKALSLENALIYWGMLFTYPGLEWKSESQDWLALWVAFLNEKWTRSVNRDMWNMALEFATKTMEDETLGFWTEDGAWPSVIDTFVAWCHQRGIGRVEKEADMDIDS